MSSMSSRQQHGFTVVELLVAMALASIVMIGLVGLLVSMVQNSDRAIKTSTQVRDNQAAFSAIQRDLGTTVSFTNTADVTDAKQSESPLGALGGWQFQGTGENLRMLILKSYATTQSSLDANRSIVYYDDNVGGCPVGRTPVTNNIIYYVKDGTLYRRMLVATSAPGATFCSGQTPAQVNSCMSGCSQKDIAIASNIESFKVTYYSAPADMTALDTVYTDDFADADTILPAARAVRIDITSRMMVAGSPVRVDSYRRMTKGGM